MKTIFCLLRAWLIILTLLYGFKLLAKGLALPMPASILAMLTLFVLLSFGVIKECWIKPATTPLLAWMGVFFVPASVGVIEHLTLLKERGIEILIAVTISTIMVLLVSGHAYQKWEDRSK